MFNSLAGVVRKVIGWCTEPELLYRIDGRNGLWTLLSVKTYCEDVYPILTWHFAQVRQDKWGRWKS